MARCLTISVVHSKNTSATAAHCLTHMALENRSENFITAALEAPSMPLCLLKCTTSLQVNTLLILVAPTSKWHTVVGKTLRWSPRFLFHAMYTLYNTLSLRVSRLASVMGNHFHVYILAYDKKRFCKYN